ncbi:hypothetical protein ROZALSC1DRAFT_27569, partial [Rozella allomycis CSF55]
SRTKRIKEYGIDAIESVVFKNWHIGGEFVQNIVIKNVSPLTQKITYTLPRSKIFSMEFPEVKILSTGMSWTIPVTFRPVKKEEYKDNIEFKLANRCFYFTIAASLAKHEITFDSTVNFGYCPVNEIETRVLKIKNTGELTTEFKWDYPDLFKMHPSSGSLKPKESVAVEIQFLPRDASKIEGLAVCAFGENLYNSNADKSVSLTQNLLLQGIGKYPFIKPILNENITRETTGTYKINFGTVLIGKSYTRRIEIANLTKVKANFSVKQVEFVGTKHHGSPFEFNILKGQINNESSTSFQITYKPKAPGSVSVYEYVVKTLSGNQIKLCLAGRAEGPKYHISNKIIQFGDVELGTSISKILVFSNLSKINLTYQFYNDTGSVFSIDKSQGNIPPETSLSIVFKFSPNNPIHYYKRVYCLVENQEPSVIEILGTCYSEKQRPPSMLPDHLAAYKHRVDAGLSFYPPELLEDMLKNGTVILENGLLVPSNLSLCCNVCFSAYIAKYRPESRPESVSEQFFLEQTEQLTPQVYIENPIVDFGTCSKYRMVESLPLKVVNCTKGKISCSWDVLNTNSIFFIQPDTADINAKSSYEFRVSFRPSDDDRFYGQHIDGYACFKSMRSFRLVNEETFTPPIHLSPYISGNTFSKGDSFIPKISFNQNFLEFPSCMVGEQIYKSINVTNTGDTSVKFWFSNDNSGVFAAKPNHGLLSPNQSQIILFRFTPLEFKEYKTPLVCHFNYGSSTSTIEMLGTGYLPKITLEPNLVCFKPTWINGVSERVTIARNVTNVPLYFKWEIPFQYRDTLEVQPAEGYIGPSEAMQCTWFFAPTTEKSHVAKVTCRYADKPESLIEESDLNLLYAKKAIITLMGQGCEGTIQCDKEEYDFGNLMANNHEKLKLSVTNKSDCDLACRFKLTDHSFRVEDDVVVFPARVTKIININAFLKHQRSYLCDVLWFPVMDTLPRFIESSDVSIDKHASIEKITTIKARGVFPLIQIKDVKCDGIDKITLWQAFSIDKFNESLKSHELLQDDSYITFNFGNLVLNQGKKVVYLHFVNSGCVDVEWVASFPDDFAPGEFSLEPNNIDSTSSQTLEQQLFDFNPKTGVLTPGQSTVVKCTYDPRAIGDHTMPVILKNQNGPSSLKGRVRMILMTASTQQSRSCRNPLTFEDFNFVDIPVGLHQPVIQTIPLINETEEEVSFEVDTSSIIDALKDIFQCSSIKGIIPPRSKFDCEWTFSPLEENYFYETEFSIKINDEKTYFCKIRGTGLASHALAEAPKIPTDQTCFYDNQLAFLSNEILNFGWSFSGSSFNGLCKVANRSECDIDFEWEIESLYKDTVCVYPTRGTIPVGQSYNCRVVLKSSHLAKFYNLVIKCNIYKTEKLADYHRATKVLEQLKQDKRNEITVSNFRRKSSVETNLSFSKSTIMEQGQKPRMARRRSVFVADYCVNADMDVLQIPKASVLPLVITAGTLSPEDWSLYHFPVRGLAPIEEGLNYVHDNDDRKMNVITNVIHELIDKTFTEIKQEDIVTKLTDEYPLTVDKGEFPLLNSKDQRVIHSKVYQDLSTMVLTQALFDLCGSLFE